MRETRTPGSVRGAARKGRPYRDLSLSLSLSLPATATGTAAWAIPSEF